MPASKNSGWRIPPLPAARPSKWRLTSADGTPMVATMVRGRSVCRRGLSGSRPTDVSAGAGGLDARRLRQSAERWPTKYRTGSSRCTMKGGCTGFRCGRTWGRRWPWARATSAWKFVSYLPDAQPDAAAHFTTASQQPNNPMLELKVYLPGKDQPLRQIAFAKNPLPESRWNSRLELPGQVLVSPSGRCAGSGHTIPANAGRQAALPGHRGRQDASRTAK